MKKLSMSLALVSLFAFQAPLSAMELSGEQKTYSPVYQPTKSVVKKTLRKMGVSFVIDGDGDIKYKLAKKNWTIYVIFDTTSSGKLWNIQMLAQFSTKKSHYDELIEFANHWNATKKYPKVSMRDRDTLKIAYNYPVEYGFNPDEFEDNVLGLFEETLKQIGEKISAMRL